MPRTLILISFRGHTLKRMYIYFSAVGIIRESGIECVNLGRLTRFSFLLVLDRPSSADANGKYSCQVIVSWDEKKDIPIPDSSAERVRLMKSLTADWAEPFRSLVHNIPDNDTEVQTIPLEDWIFRPRTQVTNSRVALMGDSAHTMTMFRGEGANNALVDVLDFVKRMPDLQFIDADKVAAYEKDVFTRAEPSVVGSRQACLDAHDFARIANSPLVAKRELKEEN